jgi:hypothetical protein
MVKSIKGSYKIQYHPNPEQEPDNVRSFFTRFFNSVFFTVNFLHGIFNCGFVVLAVLKIMPIIDVGHQKVDHSTFIYHFIFDLFQKDYYFSCFNFMYLLLLPSTFTQVVDIDFTPPWPRYPMVETIEKRSGTKIPTGSVHYFLVFIIFLFFRF